MFLCLYEVKVAQSCPTLCNPMDCIVIGILQARTLEWVAFPFSRGSSQPRDWTQVSCLAVGFFAGWATQGKPKNTRVGSLSLLQWIFPTQESNRGLLCCRLILYQLSYDGLSIYVYVYICIYMYICMYILYTCICVYIHTYMYMCIYTYTYIYVCVYETSIWRHALYLIFIWGRKPWHRVSQAKEFPFSHLLSKSSLFICENFDFPLSDDSDSTRGKQL